MLAAAGLGAAVSFYVCVGCWLGRYAKMNDTPGLWLLLFAVPVVWLPTLILAKKKFPGARGRAVVKIALRQAPPFRRAILYGSLAYSAAVWCVPIARAVLGKSAAPPHEGVFFSAAMLVMYAAAGAACSSALAAAREPESLKETLP